jgi:hypothetical protein
MGAVEFDMIISPRDASTQFLLVLKKAVNGSAAATTSYPQCNQT